jgi:hypothetical protein
MRILALFILALLGAVSVGAVALAAGGGSDGEIPVGGQVPLGGEVSTANATPQQVRDADASHYAADFGVSHATALQRLAAQATLGTSLERLEQRFPDRFAGGWFEHAPTFRAIARFKGAVPPEARELAGDVVLRGGATWSVAELQTRADQVFDDLADTFDTTLATTFDVQSGAVEASIEIPEDLRGASEAQLRSHLPASARAADVRVRFDDAPVAGDEHSYGGAMTTLTSGGGGCTTGFPVFRLSDGEEGVLTAGHCGNDRLYDPDPSVANDEYDMDWIAQHRGQWGDFQWHTTDHREFDEFYFTSGTRVDLDYYISAIYGGSYFCKYGRTTGNDCDQVLFESVSMTDDDGFRLERLVATLNHVTAGGDSGGPWYLGDDAVGVHTGFVTLLGEQSVFSRITYADNGIPGIGLKTS